MNYKIIKSAITITLLILFNIKGNCQTPTLVISEVKVNNQLITNDIIDFGDAQSVVVKFKVQFTKPDYLEIGQVSYVAGTNKNNGWSQLFTPQYFTLGLNNTGFSDLREYTIYASDYSVNSVNNYLSAIVQQTTGQTLTYTSNKIYIKRNPQFTLISNVNSVTCGSTTPVNFTMQNIDNVGITYHWHIGSGWLLPNGTPSPETITSTINSLSLTPTSFPLSSINVTPIYNGNSLAVRSKTITLAPYSITASISGSSKICTSGNYSVAGLLSGETVQWSLSSNTIASLSNSTANSVTVNKIGNGTVNLIATITNSCNQTTPVIKTINIGAPTFPNTNMSGDNNPLTGETIWYSVQAPTGYTSLQWYFDYAGTTGTVVNGWQILQGQGTTAIAAKVGNPGLTYVVCKAFNSCSNSIQYMPVSIRSITDPCDTFKINIKNPIKESDNLVGKIVPPPTDPCDDLYTKLIDKKEPKKIQVFDLFGRLVFSGEFVEDNFDLKLEKLTKGTYLLNITLQDGKIQHETIIVE